MSTWETTNQVWPSVWSEVGWNGRTIYGWLAACLPATPRFCKDETALGLYYIQIFFPPSPVDQTETRELLQVLIWLLCDRGRRQRDTSDQAVSVTTCLVLWYMQAQTKPNLSAVAAPIWTETGELRLLQICSADRPDPQLQVCWVKFNHVKVSVYFETQWKTITYVQTNCVSNSKL